MKKRKRFQKEQLQKGVYVIPNMVTSLNMFCGFYAMIAAINGSMNIGNPEEMSRYFVRAAFAILVAGLFDNLDGKIARATNTTSRFGVEYDSLADLISFGVAPALIIYLWALRDFGRLGWLAAFLFVACGALRLARFNTQSGSVSSEFFVGLPIPAAAGMSMVTLLFYHKLGASIPPPLPIVILIEMYVLSFLMISNIKYQSFKKPALAQKRSFKSLFYVIMSIVIIFWKPHIVLFLMGLVYVSSGPVSLLLLHRKKLDAGESPENSSMDDPPEKLV